MKRLMHDFFKPAPEFRGAPFWAWNSKLKKEELIRQVHIFAEMGFGGFFIHSRIGLNTRYLGKEWFDCIQTCIEEAKKLGLKVYLYDEDRWPSGAAGSLVTKHDCHKINFCKYELLNHPSESSLGGRTLAWFSAQVKENGDGIRICSVERLSAPEEFRSRKGRRLLRFAAVQADRTPWFNGETYLDTLNPSAVRAFLDSTHEVYARNFGSEFGRTIPAIFTDEPCFSNNHREFPPPWTDAMTSEFQARYGENLLDLLPEIFFVSLRKYSTARLHFVNMATDLFVQAFACQIGDWCACHKIDLTGHVLMEDALSQSFFVGSAMRFYEYMQRPGIDILTEHWRGFNTVKQCSSVARQFGRKWCLSETNGCTGWDFPFLGHKALGDWQYALGINFRCLHLAWYSAEGEAKRDYPASISYQSSWYEKYKVVEQYFSRLGVVLSEGQAEIDLMVVHPVESVWLGLDFEDWKHDFDVPEWKNGRMNRDFLSLSDRLLERKLDFDFGDEEIISRHGKIRDGRLWIGQASYQAVLIPRLRTIRRTTTQLLLDFSKEGGMVVYLGTPPKYLDGVPSKVPFETFQNFQPATLHRALEMLIPKVRKISVSDRQHRQIKPVLGRLSRIKDGYAVFLTNYGKHFSGPTKEEPLIRDRGLRYPEAMVEVHIPECGKVYELDSVSGKILSVAFRYENNRYQFNASFDVLESHLYLFTEQKLPVEKEETKAFSGRTMKGHPMEKQVFQYRLDENNILLLDHADWKINGKLMGKNEFILSVDDQIRQKLGCRPRGGEMIQPWLRSWETEVDTVCLELVYHFRIEDLPQEKCMLGMEHPENYTLKLNGNSFSNRSVSWWFDRSVRCISVPKNLLRQGDNILSMTSRYHENLSGLEAVYFLGKFGVFNDAVTSLPEYMTYGDWGKQGFPYYAGNITYDCSVRLPESGGILEFDKWRGALLGVRINGADEIPLPWPPFQVNLPGGDVHLEIKVYGSRRNAMGPFYDLSTWPVWTGPYQFKMQKQEERRLVPSGLLSPLKIRIPR